jgi:hypothetical protein
MTMSIQHHEQARTALESRVLLEAIDNNRIALNALLDKIHEDMGRQLIVHPEPNPDGSEKHVSFEEAPLGRVLLVNYVAAFLAGESPADPATIASIDNFYQTGLLHGSAYAGARQARLH